MWAPRHRAEVRRARRGVRRSAARGDKAKRDHYIVTLSPCRGLLYSLLCIVYNLQCQCIYDRMTALSRITLNRRPGSPARCPAAARAPRYKPPAYKRASFCSESRSRSAAPASAMTGRHIAHYATRRPRGPRPTACRLASRSARITHKHRARILTAGARCTTLLLMPQPALTFSGSCTCHRCA